MSFVAKCEQCGVLERGDRETVGDAVDDHDRFHDTRVQRVATDGGTEANGIEQYCEGCGVAVYECEVGDSDGKHWIVPSYCPKCGCKVGTETQRKPRTDGGEDIEGLSPEPDAKIGNFVDLAEERSQGVGILNEPQKADLTLVELSASYLDADGILRTFSVTADGFDPDEYRGTDFDSAAGGVVDD